jgi:DNA-binding PadR family transcriptional regulator
MGNVYRFVEPVVLYMLREKGGSHGYELANTLQEHALTDAEIEGAALYRTLRRLEEHGYVQSTWNVQGKGPARRIYSVTRDGLKHLKEWAQVMDHLSNSMSTLVTKIREKSSAPVRKSVGKRTLAANTPAAKSRSVARLKNLKRSMA